MTSAVAEIALARAERAERLRALASGEPEPLARERRAALERFETLGWPTHRQEAWRHTSLAALARASFAWPAAGEGEPAPDDAPSAGVERWSFVDGQLALAPAPGAPRSARASAGPTHPAGRSFEPDEPHALAALNTALCQEGLVLGVPAGTAAALPVEVLFAASRAGLALFPRLSVHLGRGASLVLIERHRAPLADGAASLSVPYAELVLEEDARLDHAVVLEGSGAAAGLGLRRARLARGARLTSHVLAAAGTGRAGGLLRDELEVELAGPGAEVALRGLALVGPGGHVDGRTFVDHAVPHGTSRQLWHAVAAGDGRSVFHGAVLVRPDAQGTVAEQQNKNLLLGDAARADTKPELEIFADDVRCSHGATIGQLDPEALFYLRSRALDEAQARALLTRAFAATVLAELPAGPARLVLEEALERALAGPLASGGGSR